METLTNYIKNFAFENYEETPIRTPGGNVGDDFLQKVYDTSFMRSLNKSFTDQLIKEAEKKTALKPDVEAYVIGYGLFGMLNKPVSLPEAEKRAAALLEKTEAARPAGCKQQVGDDSEEFNEWARGYAAVNFLVAVIAGQKKEYAKSAYHFLKAFKIHLVPTRTPFADYASYVFGKLPPLAKSDYPIPEENRTGFSPTAPLGEKYLPTDQVFMDSFGVNAALYNLETKDGDEIAAIQLGSRRRGFMQRIGSTIPHVTGYSFPLDTYDTFIVDKKYNVYRARLWVNAYVRSGATFELPDEFTMPISFKELADIANNQETFIRLG